MTTTKDYSIDETIDKMFAWAEDDGDFMMDCRAEAKKLIFELITKEIIGEDEALYVASPPIMLPVTTNPLEVMEVEYQREKIMREIEQYKIIMVKSNLRQEQRQKASRLFSIKETK